MANIEITGIFGRVLNDDNIESYSSQIDRLVKQYSFTVEAAKRICALGEHFQVIPISEKADYIGEILEYALPFRLANKLRKELEDYYK
jgi:hypothetical protein